MTDLPNLKSFSRAIAFALISGTKEISDNLSLAALLFSGGLAQGYPFAAVAFLFGTIAIRATVGVLGTMPHAVGSPDHKTGMSIVAGLLGGIVVVSTNPEAGIATALVICGGTSLLTGLVFATVGFFRLAHFARLLPYPVLGGFLAGSGWLLARGGLLMALGAEHDKNMSVLSHIYSLLSDPKRLAVLLPAVVLAGAMFIVVRKKASAAPILIVGGICVFYLVIQLSGIGIGNAHALGWLPAVLVGGPSLQLGLSMVHLIDWTFVLKALPLMFFAAALSTVSILLNISSLSLRLRTDVNVNREMITIGLTNMAIGSFGGMAGFISVSSTTLAHRLDVSGKAASLSVITLLILAVIFAGQMTSLTPIFLTSGMVLYAGLDFLVEWLVKSKQRLPFWDWMLILVIFSVILFLGIFSGIVVGVLLSVVLFVVNYARIPVIRTFGNVSNWRSHVDRSPEESASLGKLGGSCEIVSLQGYLFFATAETIVDHVRSRLKNSQHDALKFLVLDFSHVGGCDLAAIVAFANIVNIASKSRFLTILAGMSGEVRSLFERSGMIILKSETVLDFVDVDHAIEFCEEALLADGGIKAQDTAGDAMSFLTLKLDAHADLPAVLDRFRTIHLAKGDYLIRKGDTAEDVFIILSGRVHVQIDLPNGRTLRLRTLTPGAIVGDIALYTGQRRTADVVIDEDTTVLSLSAEDLAEIERSYGNLAASIHRIFARTLAEKLVLANNTIRLAQR
ncbi:MAG: cyclic nucleotide-binding domain-containing protein [Pseudomonadota bacterium]